jgi:hypothetical protein
MALSGRLGRQITDAPAKPFPISLFLSQPLGGTHPLGLQPGYAAKYLGDLLGQQCPLSVRNGHSRGQIPLWEFPNAQAVLLSLAPEADTFTISRAAPASGRKLALPKRGV